MKDDELYGIQKGDLVYIKSLVQTHRVFNSNRHMQKMVDSEYEVQDALIDPRGRAKLRIACAAGDLWSFHPADVDLVTDINIFSEAMPNNVMFDPNELIKVGEK